MMERLERKITNSDFKGRVFTYQEKSYTVKEADNFAYVDPIDKSESIGQVRNIILYFQILLFDMISGNILFLNNIL